MSASYTIQLAHKPKEQNVKDIIRAMIEIQARFPDKPKMEKIELSKEEYLQLCKEVVSVQKNPDGSPLTGIEILGVPVYIQGPPDLNSSTSEAPR